jgi:hypothetical protein
MRRALRTGVLVVGWGLFLSLWYVMVQQVSDRALALTAAVLVLAVVANAVAAGLMLLGRHDRTAVPAVGVTPVEDRLGRALVVRGDTQRSKVVRVGLDPGSRSKQIVAERGAHA